jgi:protein SCO1/2
MRWMAACALVFATASGIVPAREPPGTPAQLRGVGIDQRLNEQVPFDLVFRDESGAKVRLGQYFGGKPVILVLAYYRCPRLCTLVLNGLVYALLDVAMNIGDDFEIVTVSFDPRETPQMAAAKKKVYVDRYGRPGAAAGWHFLTGEAPAIQKLTEVVGFRYAYDAEKDQFAHASGVMVLTPRGKLFRYFYGIEFSARDLRLGLVEASENRTGTPVEQVLLFCFQYDPTSGQYGLAVMNFVRLGGVLSLLALVIFILSMWRRERRRARLSLGSRNAVAERSNGLG